LCHFLYNVIIISTLWRKENMPKPVYLGEFEQLVLLALLRLGPNAYGMRIRHEIQETANRRASLGAVYTTLDRLEDKGFVSSWLGEPTPERGGRAKKFFKIEAPGQAVLSQSVQASASMTAGLEALLGGIR
jgi:PadR family transcriptional regulator